MSLEPIVKAVSTLDEKELLELQRLIYQRRHQLLLDNFIQNNSGKPMVLTKIPSGLKIAPVYDDRYIVIGRSLDRLLLLPDNISYINLSIDEIISKLEISPGNKEIWRLFRSN